MANRFYEPGEPRAARVHALFETIAVRYDLINDLQSLGLHRHWKRRVVELARIRPGQSALDVCCGTGDITRALARRGANVVGLDFSARMLGIADQRLANPHSALRTPRFIRGDALRLPFADEQFDAVTIGYGLRNLASWRAGLAEMHRVAKPGGRLVVLDFGKPANRVCRAFYFAYLRMVVPVFGRLFCGDAQAYAYILESLLHYPAQEGVAAEMRAMGLRSVHIVNLLGGAMSINCGERP